MKNSTSKILFLFCFLFVSKINLNAHYANSVKSELQNIAALHTGGQLSGSLIFATTAYLFYSCNIPESFDVKNNYPYTQQWYEDMDKKYPDLQLHSHRFLCAQKGIVSNSTNWQVGTSEIYILRSDAASINNIYKKKEDGQKLTEVDQNILFISEFLLLNMAGYLQQNAYSNKKIFDILTMPSAIGLMGAYLSYYAEDKPGYFSPEISFISQGIAAIIAGAVGASYYQTYQACQADRFACKHAANIDVLRGGLKYFEYISNNQIISFNHPSPENRIQMVLFEIARREATV